MKKQESLSLRRRVLSAKSHYTDKTGVKNIPVALFAAKQGIEMDAHLRMVLAGQRADEAITVAFEAFIDHILSDGQ